MRNNKELLKGRNFQLREYRVSHGSLLIRSPKKDDQDHNVDIKFYGLVYISAPRHFHEIELDEPTPAEIEELRK